MNIPFTAHQIDLDKKIKNRQRFKDYYDKNKEKFSQKNKEQYLKRKETITKDEISRRKADNRRSYYVRKEKEVLDQLLKMKEEADDDRKILIDEIIADNDYLKYSKETLSVLAFLMKKKPSSSTA